ncbi:MAG: hypothetical protein AB7G13_11990 [Lautropia sp.]
MNGTMPRDRRPPERLVGTARRRIAGQAAFEYLLLVALIGLVLVTGADSPLETLVRAVQGYYGRFTFALAMP